MRHEQRFLLGNKVLLIWVKLSSRSFQEFSYSIGSI